MKYDLIYRQFLGSAWSIRLSDLDRAAAFDALVAYSKMHAQYEWNIKLMTDKFPGAA